MSTLLFFFNDTATTEIYTLSLHDALPIYSVQIAMHERIVCLPAYELGNPLRRCEDRKSTRLNSSHLVISYAVFCLKKKNIRLSLASRIWWIMAAASLRAAYSACTRSSLTH